MDFNKSQEKFLKNKKNNVQVLKGNQGTGKTTVALYKAVEFEKNYCLYNNDKVVFIASSKNKASKAKEVYLDAREELKDEVYSLFSIDSKCKFEVTTIKDLVDLYSKAYIRENKLRLVYSKKSSRIKELSKVYNDFKNNFKITKFLEKVSIEYLLEETEWIKAAAFTKEEYQEISRKGRKKSIRVNSETREQIYEISEKYSFSLNKAGYMDKYDEVLFAIKQSRKSKYDFTHVVLDDCECLTKAEFNLIHSIRNEKYGILIFIVNKEIVARDNVWLKDNRNISTVLIGKKTKNFLFKKEFEEKKEVINFIDKYQYKDMRKDKLFDFIIDCGSSVDEIIVNENNIEKTMSGKELLSIPVYNDIAAGQPIEMNDMVERTMNIPKMFLGTEEEVFMLHVKGDSMIDKNIDDDDFVIIKKQSAAYHNEIVAVSINGQATLKTLNLNNKKPLLMPANIKYEPIKLEGNDINILGTILGVLKKKK